jgi:MTH538 TIR-like domain (DUF1863)
LLAAGACNLEKSGPDLADYIRAEMEKCTQLLAVISAKTRESQWVPWEIGVATEKERPLASFVNPHATIPEFLRKWPYLQSLPDVDRYAAVSKSTHVVQQDSLRRTMAFNRPENGVPRLPYLAQGPTGSAIACR